MSSPLRDALIWLGQRADTMEVRALADLAQVTPIAARRYATKLACQQVLHIATDRLAVSKGPAWATWVATKPKTKTGGASRRYLAIRYDADMRYGRSDESVAALQRQWLVAVAGMMQRKPIDLLGDVLPEITIAEVIANAKGTPFCQDTMLAIIDHVGKAATQVDLMLRPTNLCANLWA